MSKFYSRTNRILLALLWVFCATGAFAQQRTVTGSVKDETGSPLPGVSILVVGTSNGTVSDVDGKFSIQVGSDARLQFAYVGYEVQVVEVGQNTVLDVSLAVDVKTLTEVVVTGYASQQKKDLTGSVGTVKVAELTQVPSNNVTNQLQGRIAGVTVSGDGRPGNPAKVRIRVFGSFLNNDPLYIVDGVPTQDISTINPNDIESLSVLKDAGAASIYGSRASNGVIIVTTKKGQRKGVKVNYDMFVGSVSPGKSPDFLLNAQEYADLQWLVYRNDGTNETHPVYGPSSAAKPSFPAWAGDTDWYDAVTRQGSMASHDISMSGGNESAKFYAGLQYFNQNGIALGNFQQRFSARINSEFKIKDRVTIGENLTVTGRTGNQVSGNGTEESPVARVYMTQPIIPVRVNQVVVGSGHTYQPGEYGGTGLASRLGSTPNPVADLERAADNRQQDIRILGSIFADVKILEHLKFRTTFGGTFGSNYNTSWTNKTYERAENQATSSYFESAGYGSDWVWTNQLTYDKTFGNHKLLAVAGYEAVKYGIGRGLSAGRAGYFSSAFSFRTVSNGAQILSANSGLGTPTTLLSQFVRADYSFSDKYLLSATVRRDGSSRFGADFRYGVFPSISAGWRISEEAFMADMEFISDLKIRGGYGTMGNQLAVSPANQFFLFGGNTSDSNYDLNGTGTSSLQGFRPTRIGNPNAKWETNVTTNIGFDAGLFDNKLQVSFDWYNKLTQDLLYNPPLPGTAGAADVPFINIAEMQNTGIDISVNYKKAITSDLTIDGTLTFTTYKNTINKVADGINFFDAGGSRIGSFSRNQVGRAVSEFFGYQVAGLFQTSAEVAGAPDQDGAEPGFFRYANVDDSNNAIDPNDRTFIGNPNPDFTYGLNIGLNYKNFDASVFFYGSQGNEIFNYNRWWLDFWPSFQNQKSKQALYESWTPTRTNTNVPKASNKSNFSNNTVSNSYYVEDGSFLRAKNVQIGYTFPQSLLSKVGLTSARVYGQATNLFTLTNYSGLDPDVNNDADTFFGVDAGSYPVGRQFTFGLNLGF